MSSENLEPHPSGDDQPGGSAPSGPNKLVFDGTGGSLFVVYLVNILFTILTLGIYQFWAKTRIRRFVWAHFRYKGDAFEYTGTGMELFLGFVIVFFIVLLPLYGVSYYLQIAMMRGDFVLAGILYAVLVVVSLFLFGLAIYRAYRYRLTRTLWRGIRGALSGSALTYAIRYFGYTLLQIVTLGLATPYTMIKLYDYMLNNIWIGSGRFSFTAEWKPLMKVFLVPWALYLVGLALIIYGYSDMFAFALEQADGLGQAQPLPPEELNKVFTFVFGGFVVLLTAAIAGQWFAAKTWRVVADGLEFDGMKFKASITGGRLLGFHIVNYLLLIFTFFMAFPWVQVRIMNLIVTSLELEGEPDFEKISQRTDETPKFGEGLAEAFDIGGI